MHVFGDESIRQKTKRKTPSITSFFSAPKAEEKKRKGETKDSAHDDGNERHKNTNNSRKRTISLSKDEKEENAKVLKRTRRK